MSEIELMSDCGWMDPQIDARAHHTSRVEALWYKILLRITGFFVATLSVFHIVSFLKKFSRAA